MPRRTVSKPLDWDVPCARADAHRAHRWRPADAWWKANTWRCQGVKAAPAG